MPSARSDRSSSRRPARGEDVVTESRYSRSGSSSENSPSVRMGQQAGRCRASVLRERRRHLKAHLGPPPQPGDDVPDDEVPFAFDGDAVVFSAESDLIYRERGLNRDQPA